MKTDKYVSTRQWNKKIRKDLIGWSVEWTDVRRDRIFNAWRPWQGWALHTMNSSIKRKDMRIARRAGWKPVD